MTIRVSLVTVLAALAFVAIGAAGAVGVMVWEPWEDNRPSLTDRIAICERQLPVGAWRSACLNEARFSFDRWECYAKYPSELNARERCLKEAGFR